MNQRERTYACKYCGQPIKWRKENGKPYAINPPTKTGEVATRHGCMRPTVEKQIASWPNESGLRKLKDLYATKEVDIELCQMVLLLVDLEVDTHIVEKWTEDQRRHAANWAVRVYMRASDNGTEQLARPEFLP